MKTPDLKKWLRDNSSGVYRPAREAANLIDQLEHDLQEALKDAAIAKEQFRRLDQSIQRRTKSRRD